ncbi:MAG: hypothetical protein KC561_15760, partial [Myxococcales bacterium]|nr:hypothetical protein [Myxococcales bacterium]
MRRNTKHLAWMSVLIVTSLVGCGSSASYDRLSAEMEPYSIDNGSLPPIEVTPFARDTVGGLEET